MNNFAYVKKKNDNNHSFFVMNRSIYSLIFYLNFYHIRGTKTI